LVRLAVFCIKKAEILTSPNLFNRTKYYRFLEDYIICFSLPFAVFASIALDIEMAVYDETIANKRFYIMASISFF
jgi:hypothetical protein